MNTRKQKNKRSEKSENKGVLRLQFVDYNKIQDPLKLQAFIDWIAIPKVAREPKNYKDFAKQIGVNQDTLTDWKHLIGFWQEVQKEQKEYFKEETTEVLSGLLQRAKTGKAPEVKLFLQYFEGFSEKRTIEEPPSALTKEREEEILNATSKWLNVFPNGLRNSQKRN